VACWNRRATDPYGRWCGGRELKPPAYPILHWFFRGRTASIPYVWRFSQAFLARSRCRHEMGNLIRPTLTLQYPMRATCLTLDAPSNLQKSLQDLIGLRRSPRTHADTVKTSASSSDSSPASIRSARIRNTSDSTFRIASSAVIPYASAPGISGTSAIYRPSTSVSTSMCMGKGYSSAPDVQDGFLVSNRWIYWRLR